ncbi:MAG: hypothetical protein QG664_490 [Patescibacteria group bacterium]|nr:hypothetical protein [Patescibacteria group bacterium]
MSCSGEAYPLSFDSSLRKTRFQYRGNRFGSNPKVRGRVLVIRTRYENGLREESVDRDEQG